MRNFIDFPRLVTRVCLQFDCCIVCETYSTRAYRTRSKNSLTLNFVRRKSSVQVDSNCDEFPVSLIPITIKALKFVRRKRVVRVDANRDEIPVSLGVIIQSCFMNMKDKLEI